MDDHSLLITHTPFYLSEGVVCFMTVFAEAVLRRGCQGSCTSITARRTARGSWSTPPLPLGSRWCPPARISRKAKASSRGSSRTSEPASFPSSRGAVILKEINEALEHWLSGAYHQKIHGSIGEMPSKRFTSRMEYLRAAPDNLKDFFSKTVQRWVNKDRSVVDRRLFEASVKLIGKQVELLYHHAEISYDCYVRWTCT